MKYSKMLEYCMSDNQVKLIEFLDAGNSVKEAAIVFERKETNIYRTLKLIRKRMTIAGSGKHYISDKVAPTGLLVKGTSTLYDGDGNAKIQWVKTDREAEDKLAMLKEAVEEIVHDVTGKAEPVDRPKFTINNLLTTYISTDLHFGLLTDKDKTQDRNYDTVIADNTLKESIKYLVDSSKPTDKAIILDLGDMFEANDHKPFTPHSGNILDVDTRYYKVMRTGMMAMINMIDSALKKHKEVHFINIAGNHDVTLSLGVTAFVDAWYRNEPRVIVNTETKDQKYFLFGTTLLGFAHGDTLKMKDAGECMVNHNTNIWSNTANRYFYFGHTHKSEIIDSRLCKAESFRNLAPLNDWASSRFGRQAGTMTSITHCKKFGEISRNTFNVMMTDKNIS